jgi:hypothetical protein
LNQYLGALAYQDNVALTTSDITGVLPVVNGGTGVATLTAGYIPFGAGTSAFGSSANLFWDNTNARLGIGNSSPSFKLDVTGNFRTTQGVMVQGSNLTATASQVTLDQLNTTTSRLIAWGANTSTAGILYLGTLSSDASVGSASALIVSALQNVGIGISPARKLSVYDTSSIPVRIESSTSDTRIEILTSSGTQFVQGNVNNLLFGTNSLERVRIDSNGNLMIGTSSTTSRLSIAGSSSDAWAASSTEGLAINGTVSAGISTITTYLDTSSLRIGAGVSQKTGILITGQTSGSGSTVQFSTGGTERMRLDSAWETASL